LIRTALLLLTLMISLPLFADGPQVSEVYETYNRAETLVPVLKPILGPDDHIAAYRNKLLIKAPEDRQNKILEMLKEFDRPPHNLLIQVRYSNHLQRDRQADATSVSYESEKAGVRVQAEPRDSHKVVVYKGSSLDDKIKIQVMDSNVFTTQDDSSTAQVRVMEGEQGFINVGEERPQTDFVFLSSSGVGATTSYRRIGKGFYVIPRIVKDRVRLELYTTNQRAKDKNGEIQTTEAQSVLLVDPDVWTPFAGAGTTMQQSANAVTYSTRSLDQSNQGLEIKVSILK